MRSSKISNAQQAYEYIRQKVTDRKFLPGEQIVEGKLAEELQMSRTPVREAIRKLSEDGLVEIIPNKGSFMKSVSKEEIIMGYEMGEALVGMSVYLLAQRRKSGNFSDQQLEELDEKIQEMDSYLKEQKIKEWAACDQDFHRILVKMTGNTFLIQAHTRMNQQLNHVLWFITPASIDKNVSNKEHRRMMDAIRKGDAEGARTMGQNHMRRIIVEVKRLL